MLRLAVEEAVVEPGQAMVERADREIQILAEHEPLHVRGVQHLEAQIDLVVIAVEFGERRRDRTAGIGDDVVDHGDVQIADETLAQLGRGVAELLMGLEEPHGLRKDALAGRCQAKPRASTLAEPDAEARLQLPDLVADRGLTDIENRLCIGEPAALDNGFEHLQQAQIGVGEAVGHGGDAQDKQTGQCSEPPA